MLFRKKKKSALPKQYDKQRLRPVIRCSICTGEEVAGFQDLKTGSFSEEHLLSSKKDLEHFMQEYGITEITRIY